MSKEHLSIYYRSLPHWRLDGSTYFVTWRVAKGQADLGTTERDLVAAALRFFDCSRYDLLAFVVMNDHVHAVLSPLHPHSLQKILHSLKSYTSHEIGHLRGSGAVWQAESFDRIVRDERELREKLEYIAQNPFKRWPGISKYRWLHFKQ